MKNFKKIIIGLVFGVALFNCLLAFCSPNDVLVKIAILDNLQTERLASVNYVSNYSNGLNVAATVANKQGIKIDYKTFPYGKNPLDILNQIKKVAAWNPDVIIGPRSSDKFLLLQNYFANTLVLSPLATASGVAKMPNNFYSLTFPDAYSAQAMFNFIQKTFPTKGVFGITEIDCKSCSDTADAFSKIYENSYPNRSFIQNKFVDDQVETLDIADLMKGYKKGDVILLPNDSYTSGVLVARISNFLKQPETIFIGGDYWGAWQDGDVGKIKTLGNYIGYRISPWPMAANSKEFTEIYSKLYHQMPSSNTAYISYVTVMSAITAYKLYSPDNKNVRTNILLSFQRALLKDPNWFRSKTYAVYKLQPGGEKNIGTISVLKEGK